MHQSSPWLVPWHQNLVYRIMHALRKGDGKIDQLFLTFEQGLDVIKQVYHLTCGVPQNQCIYLDAFIGARKDELEGPISPYLGISKQEEGRTQRKIFRYWRDHGIDVASEYVIGIRIDRFVGLQP